MLARLFRYGRLSYHGGFINLVSGRSASLPVDPTVWQRIIDQNQRTHGHEESRRIKTANVPVVSLGYRRESNFPDPPFLDREAER
jgi:hypothetical protein